MMELKNPASVREAYVPMAGLDQIGHCISSGRNAF